MLQNIGQVPFWLYNSKHKAQIFIIQKTYCKARGDLSLSTERTAISFLQNLHTASKYRWGPIIDCLLYYFGHLK